jgi:hypothetical protein
MSIGSLIASTPYWAFFLVIVAVCMLAAEAGVILAKRRQARGIKDPEIPVSTAVGAILGLLAFMLAFNFSITQARFGDRKVLVISHANALAACYFRANMIPEKQKVATQKLLLEYTDLLLDLPDFDGQKATITRTKEIHAALWKQAVSLKNEDMDGELRTFYVGALNDLTGLFIERATVGLIFRIPDILWTSLIILAVMGTFMLGFQNGLNNIRSVAGIPLLSAAFALVMMLIADMDATSPSRFKISQAPIKEVREMMLKITP